MRNFITLWRQPSLKGQINIKEVLWALVTSGVLLTSLEALRAYTNLLGEYEPIGAAALVLVIEIVRRLRNGRTPDSAPL